MLRREFLWQSGGGLGAVALNWMLAQQAVANSGRSDEQLGKNAALAKLHHPPKAKRVIQLFMAGAASHLDLWDHKPELEKRDGQPSDFGEKVEVFQDGLGPWMKSPFEFSRYGECGKAISEPVSELGDCVDDIAFVHNMVGKTGVHSQATLLQATGFQRPGFPGMGCWISYALGAENDELPSFVVLPDHRGFASNGPKNWSSSFLPAHHQGTVIRPNHPHPIMDLFPKAGGFATNQSTREAIKILEQLNETHRKERADDGRLEARIRAYELAGRMQTAAPDALDLSDEPEHILKMYGLDQSLPETSEINPLEETIYFGKKCLVARRSLERGVRFVQIWSGNDNGFPRRNWDSHEDLEREHRPLATGMAKGTAALIKDLKQRGLLEDTIILWTTEFGRMPSTQGSKGRDHNPFVFTNWLCGGGIKGGISYGPSDEFGYKPLDRENGTAVYDIHATILHLLGIDHTRLTVPHDGIDRRLTDVHGHVIDDLIA